MAVVTSRMALCAALFIAGALLNSASRADDAASPFDGTWNTIVSCTNEQDALGYSFQFPSVVNRGVLHGEKGVKGEPGWLTIDGRIGADGKAMLYASGLVGAAPYAVGHVPAGSLYGYHIDASFTGGTGNGRRVEGRPCTAEFAKQ